MGNFWPMVRQTMKLWTVLLGICVCAAADQLQDAEERELETRGTIDEMIMAAAARSLAERGDKVILQNSTALNARGDKVILQNSTAAEEDEDYTIQADIMLTEEERELHERGGDSALSKRKPKGQVPYILDINSQFTHRDQGQIQAAMDDYHRWTCIRFVPRTSEQSYLKITHGGGCSSYVGKVHKYYQPQKVKLGIGCRYRRIVAHELGHAIGFQHEQCRPDRDTYLNVYLNNVSPGHEHNFDKDTLYYANSFGIPYDYGSVMHYGRTFFSKNGKNTMEPKGSAYKTWINNIGRTPTLSFSDLKLANHIYHCAAHCPKKTCPNGGYLDQHCKCQCPGPTDLRADTPPIKPCSCLNRGKK